MGINGTELGGFVHGGGWTVIGSDKHEKPTLRKEKKNKQKSQFLYKQLDL